LQAVIKGIFDGGKWGAPGTTPKTGELVFEGLQVARYEKGEHFLSHEDGFPKPLAEENGFQRRATVLTYLKDVAEGGQTTFEWLGISVNPQKGRTLIFFPSFSNGLPDDRTLHAAEDAVDTKWVAQQWVATACQAAKKPTPANPLDSAAAKPSLLKSGLAGKGGLLKRASNVTPSLLAPKQADKQTEQPAVEDTAAEAMAKASKRKRSKRKDAAGKSKGFG
jgi:hypothetical protein